MKHPNAKREAMVEAVLSRFFELYTVVAVIDGRYIKRPLFVPRTEAGTGYKINPEIPDAFFERPADLSACPCCGTGAAGRGHRVR